MRNITGLAVVLMFVAASGFGQARIGLSGTVEWDTQEVNAVISLDLASAGLRLPAGRTQGEALISSEYLRLIRPAILSLQVDSSYTISDLVRRGELTMQDVDNFASRARAVPPALSRDFTSLAAAYTLNIADISAALIRHTRPVQVPRTIRPVPASFYTGIIIIASESLPIHGRMGSALAQPCLFPQIWDSEMNLIFERNMLNTNVRTAVRYFRMRDIFAAGPSGLSPEITSVVGTRPLRIFAQGVFGITPSDLIIDRDDVLLIISNEENRRLLSEGRIAIILDESVLKNSLAYF